LLEVRNHYSQNSTGPQNAVAFEEKTKSVLPRKVFKKMRMVDNAKRTVRKRYAVAKITSDNAGQVSEVEVEVDVDPCRVKSLPAPKV
jgi:hypothetical protein